jgi:hypothetical protein
MREVLSSLCQCSLLDLRKFLAQFYGCFDTSLHSLAFEWLSSLRECHACDGLP